MDNVGLGGSSTLAFQSHQNIVQSPAVAELEDNDDYNHEGKCIEDGNVFECQQVQYGGTFPQAEGKAVKCKEVQIEYSGQKSVDYQSIIRILWKENETICPDVHGVRYLNKEYESTDGPVSYLHIQYHQHTEEDGYRE